jgi:hypothetical protein
MDAMIWVALCELQGRFGMVKEVEMIQYTKGKEDY